MASLTYRLEKAALRDWGSWSLAFQVGNPHHTFPVRLSSAFGSGLCACAMEVKATRRAKLHLIVRSMIAFLFVKREWCREPSQWVVPDVANLNAIDGHSGPAAV